MAIPSNYANGGQQPPKQQTPLGGPNNKNALGSSNTGPMPINGNIGGGNFGGPIGPPTHVSLPSGLNAGGVQGAQSSLPGVAPKPNQPGSGVFGSHGAQLVQGAGGMYYNPVSGKMVVNTFNSKGQANPGNNPYFNYVGKVGGGPGQKGAKAYQPPTGPQGNAYGYGRGMGQGQGGGRTSDHREGGGKEGGKTTTPPASNNTSFYSTQGSKYKTRAELRSARKAARGASGAALGGGRKHHPGQATYIGPPV